MRASWFLVGGVVTASLAAGLVACYGPNPADGAFTCTADNGYLCPDGLTCDRAAMLCVKKIAPDLGGGDALPHFDGTPFNTARTCEQRVQQGAFSNLVRLGGLSTAADEASIALTSGHILWLSNGTPMTATISGKTAGAPSAVTITGTPAVTTFTGGSFAKDGSYWFGGNAGPSTPTYLYKATGTLPSLTATAQPQPVATGCPFFDPTFTESDPAQELYISYPLAGCNMPQGRSISVDQGVLGKNLGTFYIAFPAYGFRSPFVMPGGTTMIVASDGAGAQLFYSTRMSSGTDAAWTAPQPIPMGAIGAGTRDVQAVVSADCATIYIASERAGGAGGLDLYAADIAAQ